MRASRRGLHTAELAARSRRAGVNLGHAEGVALVSEVKLAEGVYAPCRLAIGEAPSGWRSLDELQAAAEAVVDAEKLERTDLLRLMYTSGTTSRPRARRSPSTTSSGSALHTPSTSRSPARTVG